MELAFKARLRDGKVSFLYPEQVATDIRRFFKEGSLEIAVREPRVYRSSQQNRYYWGVLIPVVMDGLKEAGNYFDRQETHELLKHRFLTEDVIVNGEKVIEGARSTTKLTQREMNDYMDSVRAWAYEYLGITIPVQGEQTEIF